MSLVDRDGFSPFHLSIAHSKGPLAIWFLDHGADPVKPTKARATPLHLAVMYNLPDFVDLLVKRGVDLQPRDKTGQTPLAKALERGDQAMVARLKKLGVKE